MSLAEILPAVRSLPRPEQVRLVHPLIDELARSGLDDPLAALGGPHPVCFPEDNSAAAAALQRLLDQERATP
jgi:hypothetical protein